LLSLQKYFVHPQQVFGAALDTLSDETESLHQGYNLLSRPSQCLLICHSSCTRSPEKIHLVSGNNNGQLLYSIINIMSVGKDKNMSKET